MEQGTTKPSTEHDKAAWQGMTGRSTKHGDVGHKAKYNKAEHIYA